MGGFNIRDEKRVKDYSKCARTRSVWKRSRSMKKSQRAEMRDKLNNEGTGGGHLKNIQSKQQSLNKVVGMERTFHAKKRGD